MSLTFLFCTELLTLANQPHIFSFFLCNIFGRDPTQKCPTSTISVGSNLQQSGTSVYLLELPRDKGIYYCAINHYICYIYSAIDHYIYM